jgi:hypothetical protein
MPDEKFVMLMTARLFTGNDASRLGQLGPMTPRESIKAWLSIQRRLSWRRLADTISMPSVQTLAGGLSRSASLVLWSSHLH